MSREITEAWSTEALTFTHDGVSVELLALPTTLDNGNLSVFVSRAEENGTPMRIEADHHYVWSGLTPAYHDGTFQNERGVITPTISHDSVLALRSAIVRALRGSQQ